jgi:hypothetical protein
MSSCDHYCLLQHIRSSAFPYVNSSGILPSAEGSLRNTLAVTCHLYEQNLPTIVTLLPRTGLALALLLSFFSPENLLVGHHSPMFIRVSRAATGRSLTRTWGLLQPMPKGNFDRQRRLGGDPRPPVLVRGLSLFSEFSRD